MQTQELIEQQNSRRKELLDSHPRYQTEIQYRVMRFMEMAGQPVLDQPGDPGPETRKLGAKLILEEALETIESLGFRVNQTSSGMRLIPLDASKFDLEGVVDGCCDTIYVCQWAMLSVGVRDGLPLMEVCDANDRKFGPGAYKNEDGKVQKPEGWVGPDIAATIEAQRKAISTN